MQAQREPPRARSNPPRGGAPGGGQPTGVENAALSASDRGRIGERIHECYDQDTGAREYASQIVRMTVTVDEGGTIRRADLGPLDQGKVGAARAFAERARRAALNPECATLPLPAAMRGQVHTFEITFRP